MPEAGNEWGERAVGEGGGWWPAVGVVSEGGGRRRGSSAVGSIGCVSGGHKATVRDKTELSGCVLPLWATRMHETGVLTCMKAHYAQ